MLDHEVVGIKGDGFSPVIATDEEAVPNDFLSQGKLRISSFGAFMS